MMLEVIGLVVLAALITYGTLAGDVPLAQTRAQRNEIATVIFVRTLSVMFLLHVAAVLW